MNSYDLAVLGSGPGGYVAAIRGAQLGLKTCIIENNALGGICLNWGCIPTKALLKNAEILHYIKNSEKFGINVENISINFKKNIKRSRDVAKRLSKGIEFLIKKNRIKLYTGYGKLVSNKEIEINDGGKKLLVESKKIILATGAKPKTIPGIEFSDRIISYKKAMTIDRIPKRMVIIGAGAIGCEFAYYYNEFGTEVFLIENEKNILPMEDTDISKEVEKSFENSGIKILTGAKVSNITSLKTKVRVQILKDENQESISGDFALLAVGVSGNIENIGLEGLGIATENGAIQINEYNQTNIPNIYAIGDVSGPPWLAHVASGQGHIAADHAAGHQVKPIQYSNIPGCTYCQPQVGSLGLTEKQAKDKGYNINVGLFSFQGNGKAMAIGDTAGFVKLVFDSEYGELLGAHIVGPDATELINELALAKALETRWEDIAMTIHAHPTLSEAIMESAMDAFGSAIHK